MKSLEEFKAYVHQMLEKDETVEEINKRMLHQKRDNVLLVVGILSLLIMPIFTVTSFSAIKSIALGVIFSICLVTGLVCTIIGAILKVKVLKGYLELEEKYKKDVIDYLFDGMKYSYDKNRYISQDEFSRGTGISGYRIDRYKGEDYLNVNIPTDDGAVSNNWFVMSDIKAEERVETKDSEGNTQTHYETLFSGMFGYIEFPNYFKHELYINRLPMTRGCERMKLEDVEFNRKFLIYTDDQIEGRYIITTDMMVKLKKLSGLVDFGLAMTGRYLYITFPHKPLFEFDKHQKTVEEAFISFYIDYLCIFSVVTEIANNNKVFKI